MHSEDIRCMILLHSNIPLVKYGRYCQFWVLIVALTSVFQYHFLHLDQALALPLTFYTEAPILHFKQRISYPPS